MSNENRSEGNLSFKGSAIKKNQSKLDALDSIRRHKKRADYNKYIVSRFNKHGYRSTSRDSQGSITGIQDYRHPNTRKFLHQTHKLVNIGNISIDETALKANVSRQMVVRNEKLNSNKKEPVRRSLNFQ